MKKIAVGVLGATGIVGQNYLARLAEHPQFEVRYLAASEKSAGKTYEEAVAGRWHLSTPIPERFKGMLVYPLTEQCEAIKQCRLLFSALDNEAARLFEPYFAAKGFAIVSNASWSRTETDIPVVIPEINADHLAIIPEQQQRRGWQGFIVAKPNCTVQSYLLALGALHRSWPLAKIFVTTLQAVSGAGWPGVASLDILDNVIPFIRQEEEKCERETRKILGHVRGGHIEADEQVTVSASCNRVPVQEGHLACVSFSFRHQKPPLPEILNSWEAFKSLPLYSSPRQPILYLSDEDRPQPKKERSQGMAVAVGRLRPCPLLDYRLVGFSHNTIRGAAGGGILNAELLLHQGLI